MAIYKKRKSINSTSLPNPAEVSYSENQLVQILRNNGFMSVSVKNSLSQIDKRNFYLIGPIIEKLIQLELIADDNYSELKFKRSP